MNKEMNMQEDEIVTFDMLLNNAKKYIAEENIGIIEKSYENYSYILLLYVLIFCYNIQRYC